MTISCVRTHLTAHTSQVSLDVVNVHVEIIDTIIRIEITEEILRR